MTADLKNLLKAYATGTGMFGFGGERRSAVKSHSRSDAVAVAVAGKISRGHMGTEHKMVCTVTGGYLTPRRR